MARLRVEMARTLSGFVPLGPALVILQGAALAGRAGFFQRAHRDQPAGCTEIGVDPDCLGDRHGMTSRLGCRLYCVHPVLHFARNVTPGQLDVLLFGFPQEAARTVDPAGTMNPLGNGWFILAIATVFTPIIWFVTDRIVQPRLGPIAAISGAEARQALDLPPAALLVSVRGLSSFLDLFIGPASANGARWARLPCPC